MTQPVDTELGHPDFLTHYYREGDVPFQSICERTREEAEAMLATEDGWRGDGTYLAARLKLEAWIRREFQRKGGRPKRKHPIYAALGIQCRFEGIRRSIRLPLSILPENAVSFTYMDSMHTDRGLHPKVYCVQELAEMVDTYRSVPDVLEVQIWDSDPIRDFLGRK